ncbi:MAG: hypothetical protein NDJ90_04985 [Oligoflexia bacterium]|nr:hypothetical protein [Oligoflexia bacterium]
MKRIFGVLAVVGILGSFGVAHAAQVDLDCKVTEPCKFAETGLSYCVTSLSLYTSRNGRDGMLILQKAPADPRSDVLLRPELFRVTIETRHGTVGFRDESGEYWGRLAPAEEGRLVGAITLEEDFMFDATCIDLLPLYQARAPRT